MPHARTVDVRHAAADAGRLAARRVRHEADVRPLEYRREVELRRIVDVILRACSRTSDEDSVRRRGLVGRAVRPVDEDLESQVEQSIN